MNDELRVVFSAKDEIEAAMVMNALVERGIQATMQGQHIGSFRAEAPEDVKVVVRASDLPVAKKVVESLDTDSTVDWDQVDVGDPQD